jgi:hypothetical protein
MKRCSKCRTTQTLDDFYQDSRATDGRQSQCKKCCSEYKSSAVVRKRDNESKRKQMWRKMNPEKQRLLQMRDHRKKRSTPRGRLNSVVSNAIWKSLVGNKAGHHWEDLVGYKVDQLKKHLEKQFKPGMTWGNYGSVWHIDHKIPIAAFNFHSPADIDFKRCWTLKNLRPMWADENMAKGANVDRPFQPALAISA